MPQFDSDRDDVIARAQRAGVQAIVTVGSDLQSSREAITLAARHGMVFAAVGFHPHEASRFDQAAYRELARLVREPKVVAVGEIGLDFYRDLSPREAQTAAFLSQLELAQEVGLPAIVHIRDAYEAAEPILSDWARGAEPPGGHREVGVLHCFSGTLDFAQRLIGLGFLVSFAGPLTYPRADGLSAVARGVPLGKVLVETDCPYLAPQTFRGRRNEPAFVVETGRKLAAVRGLPEEVVREATSDSARRLFGLVAESLGSGAAPRDVT